MTRWHSDFVHANGLRFHITRNGGDNPPIVLAHGFSDDGRCWAATAERLAATYEVVMVDARGHGRSDAPEQGYGIRVQADDLVGVIDALGLRRPIVLGHSMGAQTALVLASRYPDVPRAIGLEDPPPWWASDGELPYSPVWRAENRAWIIGLQQQSREALLAAQRAAEPEWPAADLEPWVASKLAFSLNYYNGLETLAVEWPRLLQSIRCPALLMTGDPHKGALVTPSQAAELQRWLPQVQIAYIAGAGHSIRRDRSQRYLAVLEPFLAQVTQGA